MKIDIMDSGIIRRSDTWVNEYQIFCLKSATGVCYITNNSPQYVSGHLRLLGRDNGKYPYCYKEMIDELFGSSSEMDLIEVCSGDVSPGFNLLTVDINPDKHPSVSRDGQNLPTNWKNTFDRWYCDPPYNEDTAAKMYNTELPNFAKLLKEGARVVKPGGMLFFLLGNKNMQSCPSSLMRIGLLFCTIVPNQEVRALHIYLKYK